MRICIRTTGEELIKHARWSELVQWSSEPALYTKFHFGKYRGQRYDTITASDPDYPRWIVDRSKLEEGIKHSARHWLEASSNSNPAPPSRWLSIRKAPVATGCTLPQ